MERGNMQLHEKLLILSTPPVAADSFVFFSLSSLLEHVTASLIRETLIFRSFCETLCVSLRMEAVVVDVPNRKRARGNNTATINLLIGTAKLCQRIKNLATSLILLLSNLYPPLNPTQTRSQKTPHQRFFHMQLNN